jgi:ABC-type uncharacterized transport system YnjBCD substrate-binding protein
MRSREATHQYLKGWDPGLFARNAPLLWAWFNEIEPFLWQKGRTYPKDSASLDTLFSRGEVDFGMSYHPPHAQNKILEGSYPATVRTFVMKDGSIYNTHFTAIPFNSPNKAGAMVLANFLISVEAQLSKYSPDNWGDFPALDPDRLNPADQKRFNAVDLGPATLGRINWPLLPCRKFPLHTWRPWSKAGRNMSWTSSLILRLSPLLLPYLVLFCGGVFLTLCQSVGVSYATSL